MHLTGADIIFLFGSVITGNFHKDSDIAIKPAKTTGLRNRIIHEYGEYKDEVAHKNISVFIEFYGKYLKVLVNTLL